MKGLTKEQIIAHNKMIDEAVLVCQMMETAGFVVLSEFLKERETRYRFQDILGIKDNDTLMQHQGMAMSNDELMQYFKDSKVRAMLKKRDPETGEEEILNASKS